MRAEPLRCVSKGVALAWPRNALLVGCLFHTQHVQAQGGTSTTCSIGISFGCDHAGLRDHKGKALLHPVVGQPMGRREESDVAVMATEALKIEGRGKAPFKACFHGNKHLQRPL